MKRFLKVALLALISVALQNCKDQSEPTKEPEDLQKCEVSTETVEAEGKASTVTFDITTSNETMWRIDLDSYHAWLELSDTEGTGSKTIECTVTENPKQEDREAVLTLVAYLYGEPYYTVDITLTQHTLAPYLTINSTLLQEGFTIPGKGEKGLSIDVSSNVNWTVTVPEWIQTDQEGGNGKASISLDVAPNTLVPEGRTGEIIIASADGTLSETISVSQEFYESQSVEGVSITIYGMYGWCPAGEGTITVTNLLNSTTTDLAVSVVINDKTTIISIKDNLETGVYRMEKYTTADSAVSKLGVDFELLPDNLQVEILSWDANFKTFGGVSAEDPILIGDEATLRKLATVINKGENYSGKYFKLTSDIDVSSAEWVPIGTGTLTDPKPFSGIFDGDGHTITGLTINTAGGFKGFFGIVMGADANHKAEVMNLIFRGKENGSYDITVTDVKQPDSGVGSVAGAVINYAIISGCKNYMYMQLSANSGGIIGCVDNNGQGANTYPKRPNGPADVLVEDCHNFGDIDCYPLDLRRWNVAGIVASNMGVVKRCSNHGNIKSLPSTIGPFWNIGGIVSANDGEVYECYNTGTIESAANANNCAGIVAFAAGVCPSLIQDCYNTGFINVDNGTSAGILGNSGNTAATLPTVRNCYSIGDKTEKGGGLFGTLQTAANLVFQHCFTIHEKMVGGGSNNFASDPDQLSADERYKYVDIDALRKQATFTAAGWDFENVWAIDEGTSTPYLKYNVQDPHPGIAK